jgi:SAM-dependent methyltransferase
MADDSGIPDAREFYRDKFAVEADYDFTATQLHFLDIRYFKYVWIFSKVPDRSRVLDFGCGPGTLACLKRKNCEITGLDLSPAALDIARRINRYDRVFCTDIFGFDHETHYFDCIVSLDVFGHIPFSEKDAVIGRLKDFLKPGGVMLHGIECGKVDYDRMPPARREEFINVDGHVGIEDKRANIGRFRKWFRFVRAEVRFDILNSAEIYQKLHSEYGEDFHPAFIEFTKLLDDQEKTVFDIANGMALIRQEDLGIPSRDESGGFLFLEASDHDLARHNLETGGVAEPSELMANPNVFFKGWYPGLVPAEGGDFRLSGPRAYLKFKNLKGRKIAFTIFSLYPPLSKWKVIHVFIVDWKTKRVLGNDRIHRLKKTRQVELTLDSDPCIIEVFCDTSLVPRYMRADNPDERALGVALRDLRVVE